MLDKPFERALKSQQPVLTLRSLALDLLKQGHDQPTVLAMFEKARQFLREAGREKDEDAVMDVMDFLVGWCSPHMRLSADSPTPSADQSATNGPVLPTPETTSRKD
jgi:hypothetical protein